MNKALILLLVIFVQSQSDGILVSYPNTNLHFQDSQLEGWDGGEFPYAEDISEDCKKRSLTNDAFTRRSALDKNFMRFGRKSEAPQERRRQRLHAAGKLPFNRFIRGLKDNFIRFGRGGDKSGFIRFGRTRPEDFFRAGKSLRENFIRFGKADKNFMRFGRDRNSPDFHERLASGEPFERIDKSSRIQDNFMRFGRSPKNSTSLLHLGLDASNDSDRSSPSEADIRRQRPPTHHPNPATQTPTNFPSRPFAVSSFIPENFPTRISPTLDGYGKIFKASTILD